MKAIQLVYRENRVTGFCVIWKLWSKLIVITLFIFPSVLFIHLLILCYLFFYLLFSLSLLLFFIVLLITFLLIILLLLLLLFCCIVGYYCFVVGIGIAVSVLFITTILLLSLLLLGFLAQVVFNFKFVLSRYSCFNISFLSLGVILAGMKLSLYWFYYIIKCKNRFHEQANKNHPPIKFDFMISNKEINFLDIVVYETPTCKLKNRLYEKKTARQVYFHRRSEYPEFLKRSIPSAGLGCLWRICVTD